MLNAGAVALFSKTNTVRDSKSNDKTVKSTDFTSMFVNQSKKNSNDSVSGFKTNDSNSTASNSTKVRKEIKQLFNKSKINDSKNKQSVKWNENDLAEEEITNDDISKKYDALCQSIMELIANHLNTSPENIANSMEKLNINPQELANLQNVTKLVADVKGKTDLMGLLTETDGSNAIKSIMSELDDLIEQFKEDLGMNQQEFKDFVEDYLKVLNSQGNISENSGLQLKNDVQTDENTVDETNNQNIANVDSDDTNTNQIQNNNSTESTQKQNDQSDMNESDANSTSYSSTKESNTDDTHKTDDINGHVHDANNMMTNQIKSMIEQSISNQDGDLSTRIMRQIVDEIKFTAKPEMKSLELQLEPESLGKVSLTVASKSGVVTAQLVAQSEVTKEAIESQMANLREAMNEQGIKIEAIEVTVASHQFEQNLSKEGDSTKQQKNKSRKHLSEKEIAEINGTLQESVTDHNVIEELGNTVSYIA